MATHEAEFMAIQGFANDLPTVISDGGNRKFKVTTDKPLLRRSTASEVVIYDHAIAEVDAGRFDRLLHYHKGTDAYHLLRWRDRFFVIGEQAYSVNASFEPLSGRAKYTRDYYGLMFMHGVVMLFNGRIPEAMNAFLAHPPADLEHSDALVRAVHGKWSFEVNGVKHKTEVVYSNTFDEIVGGIHNATHGVDGQMIKGNALEGNGPFIVFDLGGGSLDLAHVKRNLSVDYTKPMVSRRIGVNQAMETVKSLFDSRHKKLLQDAEDGISREAVLDIFMSEDHSTQYAGKKIECADFYEQAAAPIIRTAKQMVQSYSKGFVGYGGALLTGGGSALFFDEIINTVFEPFKDTDRIFTTDQPRNMIEANARGGGKIAEAMKLVGRIEADRWLKAQKYGK